MMYNRKVTELMSMRVSCRSYRQEPIEDEKKEALIQALISCRASPFGDRARFYLVEKRYHKHKRVKLGTYGMIKNPQYILVGTIKKSQTAYESYGYLFEQIILKATDLGLGTCWLGYFQKRSVFRQVQPATDEILPAVSPIGYESLSRGVYDHIVQKTVNPRRRRPWVKLFFHESLLNPLTKDLAGPYTEPLEMVQVAPSAGNLQPWRIVKEKDRNRFHFCLDSSDSKKGYDKRNLQYIDMGIAMCHFELAAMELNLRGKWEQGPLEAPSLPGGVEHIATWKGEEEAREKTTA